MKKLFGFIFLLVTLAVHAQHEEAITKGAEALAKAMQKKKWEKVIDMTYPGIIELKGGEQAMLRQAQVSDQTFEQQEFTINQVELSETLNEVESGEYLMSIIPVRVTFDGPLGKLYSESSFLAVSEDGGKKWYYIFMSQISMDDLLAVFPFLSPELEFPVKRVYQK